MNILYAGTPEPSARILQHLVSNDKYNVVGVLTQPDKPQKRGKKIASSPVSDMAKAHKVNIFKPSDLNEKAFVNGIVGLMATGGSTNLVLHIPAMAKAAGIILAMEDFEDIAKLIPLMAKIYPNGLADVNHFHAAGGLSFMVNELLNEGLLHNDVKNVSGHGMDQYRNEARLIDDEVKLLPGAVASLNEKILRPIKEPFQKTGGLKQVNGNLGRAITKVSAVNPNRRAIKAPVRIFHNQEAIKSAFKNNEFKADTIFVVRFQGPRANGMPELHSLTPILSVLQDRGLKVALVTDGRMSGASGKVPSAIHVTPEAANGGPISKLQDGDILLLDADNGILDAQVTNLESSCLLYTSPSPRD